MPALVKILFMQVSRSGAELCACIPTASLRRRLRRAGCISPQNVASLVRSLPPVFVLVNPQRSGGNRRLPPEEPEKPGGPEAGGGRTVPPTPDEPEREAGFVTTAPTLRLLNHHPLLDDLLHEDALRQVPFLAAGLLGLGPVRPGADVALAPANSLAAPAGRPAPSEAAAPPLRPAGPGVPAAPLTTARGHPEAWGAPGQPGPQTTPSPCRTELPEARPAGAFQEGPPSAGPATGVESLVDTPTAEPEEASPGATAGEDGTPSPAADVASTVSALPPAGSCSWNLTGPKGSLASPVPSGIPSERGVLECAYTISVYPGYGVEIRVQNISLGEGETVTVETLGGAEPVALANESFLMRGQVIRGPTNQVAVRFQSPTPATPGNFQFLFEAYLLSCAFPARPAYGDLSVTSVHPGGRACFSCAVGYQLEGQHCLTCLNATHPFWSAPEPTCVAACGGVLRNATTGRIVSPGFPANYSNNLTCHWLLEAPAGQRLHLHFEKVSLAEDDDRLIIRNGDNIEAPPGYDSYEVEYLPIEGLLSTARAFFIELTTDSSGVAAGMALRYEAFEPGHCYEPFVKNGNFTASDGTYAVGTTVEFACEAGYTLEQGSVVIECVDPASPQWNETEPACRAVCSGEITDATGVVLSPNWPEPYGKGQDCIWGLHVEEDKRIMLDIRVLRLGKGDVLTFYDGDDLTARVLGQYSGPHARFRLYTSMADVTVQFQSDPGGSGTGYQSGFVVHFAEVPRNDTCPELPDIPNGWKTTSHPELIHGTVVTYHCYPGYELLGTELLMCHWDLMWSGDLPSCQRVTTCQDPGDVEHSRRLVSANRFPVGATVQFVCDKGYALAGSRELVCHDRQAGGPKWSDRLPKCTPEVYEPCHNPGSPDHGAQRPESRLYQAGATLQFSCAAGYVLLGASTLRCVPGHPSQWNGSPPLCKAASHDEFYTSRNLDAVAKAAPAGDPFQGSNVAFAVFLPVAAVGLLLGAVYLYISRHQGKPSLQLPLSGSHPYDHITVDSAFDNPTYEAGETWKYEVSI
ncbi:seizure protein 6 homolog [Varanus komodoensis]|uniref:seizure protein 6 homolog n=1 Tax=Varanus komodoensis TaxID=61221 RepID=UPI001CF7BFCE|nr:seizure protein 6 homolog [Varanus komodoensis]